MSFSKINKTINKASGLSNQFDTISATTRFIKPTRKLLEVRRKRPVWLN